METNIHTMLVVRAMLSQTLFRDPEIQNKFMDLIQSNIETLRCEYNPEQITYTVRVKKTSVRKYPDYRPEACFYYNIIGELIRQLLTLYKDKTISCIMRYQSYLNDICPDNANIPYIAAYSIYNEIMSNPTIICNLADIQCISDNIIQIIM